MKKTWIFLTVLAVTAAAISFLPSETEGRTSKLKRSANPVPNRYIVALNADAMRSEGEEAPDAAARLTAKYGGAVDKVFRNAIQGFSVEMTEKAAHALSSDPNVLFVEEDSYISVAEAQASAPWGLDRVDQRNVPLDQTYNYTKTGNGVNVYVVDTGIRVTHEQFQGRASVVYDSIGDGQNGNDCHGHGTHVASTIGGVTYGVAKNVSLYGIRVLGCNGIGTTATAIEGIDWLTANRQLPAVANMSMGGWGSDIMDSSVQGAINSGITFVVAAGNNNGSACNYSPARLSTAITVGASTQADARASFSNYGSCVDLFAPGISIPSAWAWNDTAVHTVSGTSMAAPHVSGAVALYLEDNQSAAPSDAFTAIMGEATDGEMESMSDGSPNMMLFTAPNVPTAADATITGSVIDANGRGLRNVVVILQNVSGGEPRAAISNAFGYFTFEDVPVGGFYMINVQSKRYTFENLPFTFTLGEDLTASAFVGTPK
ncbi:MAG: S8 family serine peptidase [Pyrinomonadaceae bacterium]